MIKRFDFANTVLMTAGANSKTYDITTANRTNYSEFFFTAADTVIVGTGATSSTYATTGAIQRATTAINETVKFSVAAANTVLTGTIDPTASIDVVGVGTLFTTELEVGSSILVTGETRTVATIVDNLNLTVTVAFTDVANDATPEKVALGTGDLNHYYKSKTAQTAIDLNDELFDTDTTNWEDLDFMTGPEVTLALAANESVQITGVTKVISAAATNTLVFVY